MMIKHRHKKTFSENIIPRNNIVAMRTLNFQYETASPEKIKLWKIFYCTEIKWSPLWQEPEVPYNKATSCELRRISPQLDSGYSKSRDYRLEDYYNSE